MAVSSNRLWGGVPRFMFILSNVRRLQLRMPTASFDDLWSSDLTLVLSRTTREQGCWPGLLDSRHNMSK